MVTSFLLDGPGWSLREAIGETWSWYLDGPVTVDDGNNVGAAAAAAARIPGWWPARVPGAVGADLQRARQVPSPYRGTGSRAGEWAGTRSWVLRRDVDVVPPGGELVLLRFDGVDPAATVWFDGTRLGRIDGPYFRATFDLTEALAERPGATHRLTVVLDPVPPSPPQVARTADARRLAPRMTSGWDFCPPMPHQGVWRSVRLDVGSVHLDDLEMATGLDLGSGTGTVVASGSVLGARKDARVLLEVAGARAAASVREDGTFHVRLTVPGVEPWWPVGTGDPRLHDATLTVRAADGTEARQTRRVGFRSARWQRNPGAPAGALAYSLVVNGVPVPLVGWNWAPADARLGEVDEPRLRHLLGRAAASGAVLVRVWGGGLVETPDFYRACDELGLLVWQEFSQSSSGKQSAPATDPAFVAHARAVARAVVGPRRHHPSLVLWGGGNELDLDGVPLDEDRSPVLAALRDEVRALDPGRGWLPTSPSGPVFHHRLADIHAAPDGQHDVHGPWEHQGLVDHYTLHDAGTSLAHTEFGVEGMANLRQYEALVPPGSRWPVDRSNPVMRHLGEWWNNAELVERVFGGTTRSVSTFRQASHLLQATGLAYAVEADRRRSPRCSMVLPWQLAESFPNAWCTAVVDHLGDTKPAYHAVARAFAPERVSLRTERAAWGGTAEVHAEAWVWADPRSRRRGASGGTVRLALVDSAGATVAHDDVDLAVAVGDPRPVVSLRVPHAQVPAVAFWEATWCDAAGVVVDVERQVLTTTHDWEPLGALPPVALDVVAAADSPEVWSVQVRNTGGTTAVSTHLTDARAADVEGWAAVDGPVGPLPPGHGRTYLVTWRDAPARGRALRLHAWNTPDRIVRLEKTP